MSQWKEDAASRGDEAGSGMWATEMAIKKNTNRDNIENTHPGTLFLKVPKLERSLKPKLKYILKSILLKYVIWRRVKKF